MSGKMFFDRMGAESHDSRFEHSGVWLHNVKGRLFSTVEAQRFNECMELKRETDSRE